MCWHQCWAWSNVYAVYYNSWVRGQKICSCILLPYCDDFFFFFKDSSHVNHGNRQLRVFPARQKIFFWMNALADTFMVCVCVCTHAYAPVWHISQWQYFLFAKFWTCVCVLSFVKCSPFYYLNCKCKNIFKNIQF